jgi:hypothetical protein
MGDICGDDARARSRAKELSPALQRWVDVSKKDLSPVGTVPKQVPRLGLNSSLGMTTAKEGWQMELDSRN